MPTDPLCTCSSSSFRAVLSTISPYPQTCAAGRPRHLTTDSQPASTHCREHFSMVSKLQRYVDDINDLEPEYEALSDVELRDKTTQFRTRLSDGETLDDLLVEAFTAVREAAKRTIEQRPYDVQLLGAVVLHQGRIAEMGTGEGKTLVATLTLYLNALAGEGCHLVTVNDYLVRRDCGWMGHIFNALGMRTAAIAGDLSLVFDLDYVDENAGDVRLQHLRPITRQDAYACDITYGTNSEFGFDYLRDNLALDIEDTVQRGHFYAVVDEVDNILIDEARTPLIISGEAEESSDMYRTFARIAPRLSAETDYTIDAKARTVSLTDAGIAKMEHLTNVKNLYDENNFQLVNYMEQAVRAQVLYQRDKDYVVQDGEVVIVDEFTGRMMAGRRWSDGLHQAVEAKENLQIQRENVTHATITLQNYFRMYQKLAGMTGTAETESEEFHKIYGLDVVVIPTNRPNVRDDNPDLIYRDERAKLKAVIQEVRDRHETGQPVLIGTTSIEKNEELSRMLDREGIPHKILNAKQHEKEAAIISAAGQKSAVTVATNMAGRGVDILLGDGVQDLGGLAVIGTERHESRRIDNQLRGRAGRQGDPGYTRFYLCLEDELMARFVGPRVKTILEKFGMDGDEPLEHKLVTRTIENAQTKVEGMNFDYRKHLVEYDDVLATQRKIVYEDRNRILSGDNVRDMMIQLIEDEIADLVDANCADAHSEEWDTTALYNSVSSMFRLPEDITPDTMRDFTADELADTLIESANAAYEEREAALGDDVVRAWERRLLLVTMSGLWIHHVDAMDELREAAMLQAFGQQDPLVAYKRQSFDAFQQFRVIFRKNVVYQVYHLLFQPTAAMILHENAAEPEPEQPAEQPQSAPVRRAAANGNGNGRGKNDQIAKTAEVASSHAKRSGPVGVAAGGKIGRNEPCYCGSGKKFKHCHGR
ncbi:MAG: preprotein translocase subunit SecA [Chloroflexi bacterium]|nr:preprotein translocase subunit SecA [Chloroflexota bacterium]